MQVIVVSFRALLSRPLQDFLDELDEGKTNRSAEYINRFPDGLTSRFSCFTDLCDLLDAFDTEQELRESFSFASICRCIRLKIVCRFYSKA